MTILSVITATLVPVYFCIASSFHFNKISDMPEYVTAGRLICSGRGSDIYKLEEWNQARKEFFPEIRPRGISIFSPPPALNLMAPVALIPLHGAVYWWMLLNFAAYIASFAMLRSIFELTLYETCWFWVWFMLFGPAFDALRIGQITPLMLFALTLFIFLFKRGALVGASFPLAYLVLKPQEFLLTGLFLLSNRRFKIVLIISGILIALVALSFANLGAVSYQQYLATFKLPQLQEWMCTNLNPTVKGQLLRLMPEGTTVTIISAIALAITSLYALWFGHKLKTGTELSAYESLELSLLVLLPMALLTAFSCHTYDLALLLPTMLVFYRQFPLLEKQTKIWALALLSPFLVVFFLEFYTEAQYDWLPKGLVINPFFIGMIFVVLSVTVVAHARLKQLKTAR